MNNSYKYSDKWTKIGVNIGICLGNSHVNFQLLRFTTSENIARSFRGAIFLTHTVELLWIGPLLRRPINTLSRPVFKGCCMLLFAVEPPTQIALGGLLWIDALQSREKCMPFMHTRN